MDNLQDKIRIDIETGLMIDAVSPYEFGEDIIETPCLTPFYKPKWNGTEWVEGMAQKEIDSLKNVVAEPTLEERLQVAEDTIMFLLMGGM